MNMITNYWTDGAATMRKDENGNYVREAGGWAVYEDNSSTIMTGGKPSTTNNEMELTAIKVALSDACSLAVEGDEIIIHSDSAYSINIFTSWAAGWEKNGWTRGKKHEPIENLDVIKKSWTMLQELAASGIKVKFEKVKGHAGVEENETVDSWAVKSKIKAAQLRKEFNEVIG